MQVHAVYNHSSNQTPAHAHSPVSFDFHHHPLHLAASFVIENVVSFHPPMLRAFALQPHVFTIQIANSIFFQVHDECAHSTIYHTLFSLYISLIMISLRSLGYISMLWRVGESNKLKAHA